MTERPSTEVDDSEVDCSRVLLNVLSGSTILVSTVMIILGLVYLDNCLSEPRLPIALTVQGFVTLTMPVWFVLKYRCLLAITKTTFLTVFVVLCVIHHASLIACTIVLSVATGCEDSEVHQATFAFMVVLWIVSYCMPSVTIAALTNQKPKPENVNNQSRP